MHTLTMPENATFSAMELPDVNVPVGVLRTAYQLLPESGLTGRSILMTSSTQGEGKTLIMRHLARALAKFLSQRVLIIELQQELSYSMIPGPIALAPQPRNELQATTLENITYIKFNTAEGNYYKELARRLALYRQEYDVIFVEGPSVKEAINIDPIVLSPLFDLTLFVFQQQLTPIYEIQTSLHLLSQAGAQNVRLLLNQSSMLDNKVSRWNLPARVSRLSTRLRMLCRRLCSLWRQRSKTPQATATKAPTQHPQASKERS